ncbi:MAG: hypothetical protein WC655_28620 [Candidatus Hydrogenedentales bacterium]
MGIEDADRFCRVLAERAPTNAAALLQLTSNRLDETTFLLPLEFRAPSKCRAYWVATFAVYLGVATLLVLSISNPWIGLGALLLMGVLEQLVFRGVINPVIRIWEDRIRIRWRDWPLRKWTILSHEFDKSASRLMNRVTPGLFDVVKLATMESSGDPVRRVSRFAELVFERVEFPKTLSVSRVEVISRLCQSLIVAGLASYLLAVMLTESPMRWLAVPFALWPFVIVLFHLPRTLQDLRETPASVTLDADCLTVMTLRGKSQSISRDNLKRSYLTPLACGIGTSDGTARDMVLIIEYGDDKRVRIPQHAVSIPLQLMHRRVCETLREVNAVE